MSLIGMGPGHPSLLTQAAEEAIAQAALLIGSPRLLEPYRRGDGPAGRGCWLGISSKSSRRRGRKRPPSSFPGTWAFTAGPKASCPCCGRWG